MSKNGLPTRGVQKWTTLSPVKNFPVMMQSPGDCGKFPARFRSREPGSGKSNAELASLDRLQGERPGGEQRGARFARFEGDFFLMLMR